MAPHTGSSVYRNSGGLAFRTLVWRCSVWVAYAMGASVLVRRVLRCEHGWACALGAAVLVRRALSWGHGWCRYW